MEYITVCQDTIIIPDAIDSVTIPETDRRCLSFWLRSGNRINLNFKTEEHAKKEFQRTVEIIRDL